VTSSGLAHHSSSQRLAIQRLEHDLPLTPEKIDRFLQEHRFPIVEGPSVTFVYRGEASEVRLQHWIFGLPSQQPFQRLAGTDLWFLIQEIPARSRVEYKLLVTEHDYSRLIEDRLNPNHARDPFGINSVVHGEGYEQPDWILTDPEARPGTVEELIVKSRALGHTRQCQIYLPARFRQTRKYPLLIVHDGHDFFRFTELKTVLDNLIHRLEIPELVVVFENPRDRLREYANDERHARFLVEELCPALETRYPLIAEPRGRGLAGASFGAVASLSAAYRHPHTFGRLMLLSGSFAFTDIGRHNHRGPLFDPVVEFVNQFRAHPKKVAERVFVGCGIYESLIYENRSLVPLLQAIGMDVRFVEARDGHNWENWRDRLREGLSWLFPGPLWLVYE
jgi:enterochelin esterase family protein